MQTHLLPRPLHPTRRPDCDVQALFSTAPDGRAVIFVHGFNGDAMATWTDFHVLLPETASCSGRDLFFFEYDGLHAELHASASLFRTFLGRLFSRSADVVNASLPSTFARASSFRYSELVVVAHSLGAVIARRALLDATSAQASWAEKVRLVLFAPAHKGAVVSELALEAIGRFPFLRFFAALIQFRSPLVKQLRPGSRELTSLLKDTENACQGSANRHLVATRVIVAEHERVVANETFAFDPPPETVPGATHTSVCKPSRTAIEPLRHVEECL
jgi:pimeloyl-ACP methyl ester carboxylesterase